MLSARGERWDPVSQALHWLVVLLILGQGTAGLLMVGMRNSPDKIQVYALHKSVGLTLLALVLLRLAWRLVSTAPARLPGIPDWEHRAARAGHALLYGLLLAVPLTGWVFNSAAGFPLRWFGLFDVAAIAGRDQALRELAVQWHEALFWVLVATAVGHAAAALYHHLFLRDATLARMLPRRWLRAPPAATERRHDAS